MGRARASRGTGFRTRLAVASALALLAVATAAGAQEPPEQLFENGVAALHEGSYDRAIATFEALADRGFVHPDAAYNRGLAYLARLRAQAEKPGDLGRAAAGFEECLLHRPSDADAEHALDLVRAEVARRSALRGGTAQVHARPTLDRAIVGLAPELVWAVCALVSSVVLTVGLVLRRFAQPALRMAGIVATPLGALGLLLFGLITATARNLRHTTAPAVVVTPDSRLTDEHGVTSDREPLHEAARVEVLDRKGGLARIRYGSSEGWTNASNLRVLLR
jgi:tetratricopeptide (TPR) repeat protein